MFLLREVSLMDYKEMLIDLINNIDDSDCLERIYRFIKRFKENWGI